MREAAARLGQYLVLTNSLVASGASSDERIMLAVLDALGELGDGIVADDVICVSYLDYSEAVKMRPRRAVDNPQF